MQLTHGWWRMENARAVETRPLQQIVSQWFAHA